MNNGIKLIVFGLITFFSFSCASIKRINTVESESIQLLENSISKKYNLSKTISTPPSLNLRKSTILWGPLLLPVFSFWTNNETQVFLNFHISLDSTSSISFNPSKIYIVKSDSIKLPINSITWRGIGQYKIFGNHDYRNYIETIDRIDTTISYKFISDSNKTNSDYSNQFAATFDVDFKILNNQISNFTIVIDGISINEQPVGQLNIPIKIIDLKSYNLEFPGHSMDFELFRF